MGSAVGEETHLEIVDRSFVILPPKYKRRKVSAIRDFPRGCGPNAGRTNLPINDTGDGHMDGDHSKGVEVIGEEGGDRRELDRKGTPEEENLESRSHDIFVSPVQESEASRLLKGGEVESDNQVLMKLPVENLTSSDDLQMMKEISLSKGAMSDMSKDLTLVRKESPIALNNTGIIYPQEPCDENKMVDKGISVQADELRHYPIPSNIVQKERKYPPRNRVSAVRDFPAGCGCIVPRLCETKDKPFSLGETNGKIHEAIALNQIEEKLDAEDDSNYKMQVVVPGKSGDLLEKPLESDKSVSAEMVMEATFLRESSDIEGAEEISDNDQQHGKAMVLSEYGGNGETDMGDSLGGSDDEMMVFKDKHKKRKSIGVSSSNIELLGESYAGVGNEKGVVLVQCLMAAPHSPQRRGRAELESSSSRIRAKKSKGKKCDVGGTDAHKRSLSKSKSNAENSMMIIPYIEETEIDEVSRPLACREEEESSDYDEADGFEFLRREPDLVVTLPPTFVGSSSERSARSKVRETLRLFQGVVRKLLQEEETKSKSRKTVGKRIDLRAAEKLRDHGKYVNTQKVIGNVPGVEVGDIFNYRQELAVIGLHTPLQSGIDSIKQGKEPIAISIVASGGYDNDVDSSDGLIFSGQGGKSTVPDKQPEDQKLERGNLALKNCIDKRTPVRVIRGFKEAKASDSGEGRPKMVSTYTYDGLYTVERYWHELGSHGKLVFKFELKRIPGQPELAWKEVKQSKKFKAREGRCVDDISEGKEKPPIPAINTIDDEKPPPFRYITSMMYPDWCQPIPPKGCTCKNGCSDSLHCACTVKNGGEIPYNHTGAIVQAKPLVYECGPLCKCPSSCHNRVTQFGIKLPLEIFKTESRGWGVRCLSSIPSGSFVCEYIGELLDDKEAEQRVGSDEYLFDIGQNYSDSTLSDELSVLMPDVPSSSRDVVESVGFTIDAAMYGNIGRFINHSCSPNLYAQNVLYDHEDRRIPHIMLFAAENIPPLQELTYHYNYSIDQVFDSQGNIKKKDCYCGSSECSGRMY